MTSTAFADIARQRRSVRGFISKPVEQALLNRVFETASTAPSNCNTQPWECAVVSGDKLETLRQRIPDAFASGQWTMDFPYDGKYAGVYKERQYQAAADLYAAMGIAREDKAEVPDRIGHGPECADRRRAHDVADDFEKNMRQFIKEINNAFASFTERRQAASGHNGKRSVPRADVSAGNWCIQGVNGFFFGFLRNLFRQRRF